MSGPSTIVLWGVPLGGPRNSALYRETIRIVSSAIVSTAIVFAPVDDCEQEAHVRHARYMTQSEATLSVARIRLLIVRHPFGRASPHGTDHFAAEILWFRRTGHKRRPYE